MTRAERQTRTYYQRALECYEAAKTAGERGEEELAQFWYEKAETYEDQAGLFWRFAELVNQDRPGEDFDPMMN